MQRQAAAEFYTTMVPTMERPDPNRASKLLELGDPDFFGCYMSNTREATVKVKSAAAAAATATDVPKLRNASITGEQTDRLEKLLDLGDPSFFGGGGR